MPTKSHMVEFKIYLSLWVYYVFHEIFATIFFKCLIFLVKRIILTLCTTLLYELNYRSFTVVYRDHLNFFTTVNLDLRKTREFIVKTTLSLHLVRCFHDNDIYPKYRYG